VKKARRHPLNGLGDEMGRCKGRSPEGQRGMDVKASREREKKGEPPLPSQTGWSAGNKDQKNGAAKPTGLRLASGRNGEPPSAYFNSNEIGEKAKEMKRKTGRTAKGSGSNGSRLDVRVIFRGTSTAGSSKTARAKDRASKKKNLSGAWRKGNRIPRQDFDVMSTGSGKQREQPPVTL